MEESKKRTNPLTFLREVREEARKVTWATRNETVVAGIMVLIMVVAASIFFLIVDWVIRVGIGLLLGLGN